MTAFKHPKALRDYWARKQREHRERKNNEKNTLTLGKSEAVTPNQNKQKRGDKKR